MTAVKQSCARCMWVNAAAYGVVIACFAVFSLFIGGKAGFIALTCVCLLSMAASMIDECRDEIFCFDVNEDGKDRWAWAVLISVWLLGHALNLEPHQITFIGVTLYFWWDRIWFVAINGAPAPSNAEADDEEEEEEEAPRKEAPKAEAPKTAAPRQKHWTEVLGVSRHATPETINSRFRTLARELHPDHGGSTEAMAELNAARRQALKEKAPA